MGLDNGIILKLSNKKVPENFPEQDAWWIDSQEDVDENGEFQVAYWRKCWDIRGIILGVLHAGQDGGRYPVEAEDLPAIRRGIWKLLNPKTYEEESDSIWTYDERADSELQILLNLMWLENYLKKHPEDSAFFYDSY